MAYLAVESDRPHTRDALAALLWPESAQETALNSLRNALANLRRAIGDRAANPPYLLITREAVQFNRASDYRLDVADVSQLASDLQADVQARTAAVEGYRGPFLEGFSVPDSAVFEEWASLWRERLARLTLEGLCRLAEYYEGRGEYTPALEFARRQVALEPWLEEGHCQVMRLLALSGQREQALRQYHTLKEILSKDLATEPSANATCLYQQILSGSLSAAPSKARPTHNLPLQTTSFIGRAKEIETLKAIILSGQTRLVTVTGAGGTGKTRLALRVAEELLEAFPQGVWLVELAAVVDPALVPITVASVLGVREVPDRPILEGILEFLRSKRVLILLDTCEHLVGAVASLVDRILHAAPQVSIQATSREILGVSGEMSFLCPSLALPDPHKTEQVSELVSCEAVRLFAERSALASPGFLVKDEDAPIVAQVCRRLDGIPLAIELAAARIRMLSVEQIAGRLDHAFHLLTGGSRTALPRQQTLKATIDWSYNLLSPAERKLLLRLSIFSGGWTLEAAEAVCPGEGAVYDNLLPEQILDLLGQLANKSLILVEPEEHGERRYSMLDTVRQYAHDCLLESGGDAALRGRHLAYFLQLAEQAEPHLRAWGMIAWLNRLEVELGNLRLALDWSLSGQIEQGLRLATALHHFWHLRSRRFEGIQWLERLLEVDKAGEPIQLRSPARRIVRGKALIIAGDLNKYYPGVYAEHACLQKDEGKTIFRELGDLALRYQPFAMFYTATSGEDLWDCLAMARRVGDDFYTAETIWILMIEFLNKGDLVQAMAFAQENLAIRQKIGDMDGKAYAFYLLAEVEFLQGNPRRAVELWEASQRGFKDVENNEWALACSALPAELAIAHGDYQRAFELSEVQLAAGQEISSSIVILEALGQLSRAAWALRDYDQVARRCRNVLGPDWESRPMYSGLLFYIFGRVALSQGDYAGACAYLSQFEQFWGFPERILCIQALGILAAATGQAKRAVIIFGALDRSFGWLKNAASPAEISDYEQALESTRIALSDEEFQSAWREGEAMSVDQLTAFATESQELH